MIKKDDFIQEAIKNPKTSDVDFNNWTKDQPWYKEAIKPLEEYEQAYGDIRKAMKQAAVEDADKLSKDRNKMQDFRESLFDDAWESGITGKGKDDEKKFDLIKRDRICNAVMENAESMKRGLKNLDALYADMDTTAAKVYDRIVGDKGDEVMFRYARANTPVTFGEIIKESIARTRVFQRCGMDLVRSFDAFTYGNPEVEKTFEKNAKDISYKDYLNTLVGQDEYDRYYDKHIKPFVKIENNKR